MERYLLFAGNASYPQGGWSDFKKDYADKKDALWRGDYMYRNGQCEWWQVVDSKTGKIIQTNR